MLGFLMTDSLLKWVVVSDILFRFRLKDVAVCASRSPRCGTGSYSTLIGRALARGAGTGSRLGSMRNPGGIRGGGVFFSCWGVADPPTYSRLPSTIATTYICFLYFGDLLVRFHFKQDILGQGMFENRWCGGKARPLAWVIEVRCVQRAGEPRGAGQPWERARCP